jgi:citrate lyase subunit beta/citryl-CoA lyase
MRSKLFVPGSRPELFAKALMSEADAISIDLEDAVVESRKGEARAHVAEFLQSTDVLSSNKIIIVRCNAPGTAHFAADLLAVTQPALNMLNLPKVESVADVRIAVEALKRAEASNSVTKPVDILATIESPAGLRRASKIAAAHSRVVGLQLGLNDLFESLHIDRLDIANVHAAMFVVRMAAGEAGVFAVDGAYPDIRDQEGFRAEAEMARRLGFCGKSCIHPRQVAPANETFMPSEDEIATAIRVVEAARQAAAEGKGAFIVDGKMIDLPSIRRAEFIVAASRGLRGKC